MLGVASVPEKMPQQKVKNANSTNLNTFPCDNPGMCNDPKLLIVYPEATSVWFVLLDIYMPFKICSFAHISPIYESRERKQM